MTCYELALTPNHIYNKIQAVKRKHVFSWAPIPAIAVMGVSGCSVQPNSFFVANLENACAYPVQVTAVDYSNAKEPFIPNQTVAAGETIEVLSQISFNKELDASVPSTYQLNIKAGEQLISLDKKLFIAQLKNSPSTHSSQNATTWTIRDSSLCP